MGVYNPNIPRVVGEEWVPIRDEGIVFSPSINVVEYGHTFTPTASRTLQTGKFYINKFPDGAIANQTMLLGVYPTGREALSGPIRTVTIPCNSLSTTGTVGGTMLPAYFLSPGDGLGAIIDPSGNSSAKNIDFYFATSQFSQLLTNKRIVKVELLHQLSWYPIQSGTTNSSNNPPLLDLGTSSLSMLQTGVTFANAFQAGYTPFVEYYGCGLNFLASGLTIGKGLGGGTPISSVNLGEIFQFSGQQVGQMSSKYPWRYEDLTLFEASAGINRIAMHYEFGAATGWAGEYFLGYVALRVSFCEEQRVAYAGSAFGSEFSIGGPDYVLGPTRPSLSTRTM